MAITREALVRLTSNLEKAHPQVVSNISGKFQLDQTRGCRETAVTDTQTHRHTNTQTHRHTDTQTHRHTDTQTHRHTDTQTLLEL